MTTPLLGWIGPKHRTQAQHDANTNAVARMPRFYIPGPTPTLAKGEMVTLYTAWSDREVIADVGFEFPRFHQLTGSCVGAGGGQALFTLIAVQRLLAVNPTKAILPFWPFSYGRCRYNEGDRGQGEGAMGGSFAETCVKEGVLDVLESGLPAFQNNDGLVLTEQLEMQWSDGGSSLVTERMAQAAHFPLGSAAPAKNTDDLKKGILNGYPFTFACDDYIGNASIVGSGADACVVGHWDGSGGHQQSGHAYWEHPTLGPLFWIQNNWPGDTYPRDPAGGPICGCWVTEANVMKAFALDAEVYIFSHLTYFPAQPSVLNWLI